jgi:hypothetical protein
MNTTQQQYWFRAKRYGLGWGLPLAWQGWMFFLAWLFPIPLGLLFIGSSSKAGSWAFLAIMVTLLTPICYLRGDPRGRRWQDGDGD